MKKKNILKLIFITGIFICISVLLCAWNNWRVDDAYFHQDQRQTISRRTYPYQLPVHVRFLQPNTKHVNSCIAGANGENIFLENFNDATNYMKFHAAIEDAGQSLEELVLKRQILQEVLEMKYFVQSELKNKHQLNVKQFLSSLKDRKKSVFNIISNILKFLQESELKRKEGLNSNKYIHYPVLNHTDTRIKASLFKKLRKSVKTTDQYINKQARPSSSWNCSKEAINTKLRELLRKANAILEDGDDQRKAEVSDLQNRVQSSLFRKQNPQNCRTSRRLVCEVDFHCGFGCVVHHIGVCMMEALAANRTLIVVIKRFIYKTDWTSILSPLSETCRFTRSDKSVDFTDPHAKDALVVFMSMTKAKSRISMFRPGTIPGVIAPQLIRLHSDPPIWWIGQILSYICRPKKSIKEKIKKFMKTHRFREPTVGVHVRRTDKIRESPYVALHRYMEAVEEWFLQYEVLHKKNNVRRKIFLASDEVNVIMEAKKRYPSYVISYEKASVKKYDRSTKQGLRTAVLDVHLLSHCDFLVCTMSSNICRLAYALLQTHKTENSEAFYSMDKPYYYFFGWPIRRIAVKGHYPSRKKELLLSSGDVIDLPFEIWNGYQRFGINLKTKRKGIFPSYKTRKLFPISPYFTL